MFFGAVCTLVAAAMGPTILLASDGPKREQQPDRPDSAVEELKRQYAAGNIPESEFEARLETLLGATPERNPRSSSHTDDRGSAERLAEAESERSR